MSDHDPVIQPPSDYKQPNGRIFYPELDSWGFFGYGSEDGPAYCGSTSPQFLWFIDRPAMLTYIRDYLPWDPRRLDNPSQCHVTLAQNVRALFDDASLADDETRLLESLNTILDGEYAIHWWGTLLELTTSMARFPFSLRRAYWSEQDIRKEDHDTTIPEDQVYYFLDFASSIAEE